MKEKLFQVFWGTSPVGVWHAETASKARYIGYRTLLNDEISYTYPPRLIDLRVKRYARGAEGSIRNI